MDRPIRLAASIMCANFMNLEQDLRIMEEARIDYIHYDVMDGIFVEDYCLGANIINGIRKNTRIPSHYHLMVEEPSRIFDNFTPEPTAIMSIHYEACRNLHRDLVNIRRRGFKVGLVLNPATTLAAIEYVITEVDHITIMTVNPGFSGGRLVPQVLKKIESLEQMRKSQGLDFEICVDGHVDHENIPAMVRNGARMLVGGSSGMFIAGRNLPDCIVEFREKAESGLLAPPNAPAPPSKAPDG